MNLPDWVPRFRRGDPLLATDLQRLADLAAAPRIDVSHPLRLTRTTAGGLLIDLIGFRADTVRCKLYRDAGEAVDFPANITYRVKPIERGVPEMHGVTPDVGRPTVPDDDFPLGANRIHAAADGDPAFLVRLRDDATGERIFLLWVLSERDAKTSC